MKPTICVASAKGPREEQQDALDTFSMEGRLLVVVCDGAGGHRGGAEAARTAVSVAGDTFQKLGGKFQDPEAILKSICLDSHRKIQQIRESPKLAPRSTVTLLYIDGRKACWAHVGDSRIYHLKGRIVERSRDHTMVQILHEQGEVNEEEMGTHPDQGRLLRALGAEDEPRASFGKAEIGAEDAFFLCTDGLWERIKSSEIEELIRRGPSQANLKALLSVAIDRNGPKGDNVSAAAVWCGNSKPRRSKIILLAIAFLSLLLIILALIFLPVYLQSKLSPVTAPTPAKEHAPSTDAWDDSPAELEKHRQENRAGDDVSGIAPDQSPNGSSDTSTLVGEESDTSEAVMEELDFDETNNNANDARLPNPHEGDPMLEGAAIDGASEMGASQNQENNNQP